MDDDARRLGRLGEPGDIGQHLGETRAQRVESLAVHRGDRLDRQSIDVAGAPEGRPRLDRGRTVHLVERDEHRRLEQRRVVGPQLLADDPELPLRVAARTVDDVDEDPGPLDVAQERVTEARAIAGALDQAGHVGDGRPPLVLVAEVHHARGSARAS